MCYLFLRISCSFSSVGDQFYENVDVVVRLEGSVEYVPLLKRCLWPFLDEYL